MKVKVKEIKMLALKRRRKQKNYIKKQYFFCQTGTIVPARGRCDPVVTPTAVVVDVDRFRTESTTRLGEEGEGRGFSFELFRVSRGLRRDAKLSRPTSICDRFLSFRLFRSSFSFGEKTRFSRGLSTLLLFGSIGTSCFWSSS